MSALPVVAANPNPHFQRLGGEAAVARLVDAFYRAMDQRDDARAIRAMHDADLAQTCVGLPDAALWPELLERARCRDGSAWRAWCSSPAAAPCASIGS